MNSEFRGRLGEISGLCTIGGPNRIQRNFLEGRNLIMTNSVRDRIKSLIFFSHFVNYTGPHLCGPQKPRTPEIFIGETMTGMIEIMTKRLK